ncbi:serine hydrolase [Neorhizobium galegae]|uniref:serine hydrolase domain-containing protein n=1 Tax=Neorhizobium galegae TaxID=399 RepID=UPI0006226253|nr:serine hydrolase [Neorhizobium galegae]CDZ25630.1 Penicillin-binding protein, beta-lactamase class C [Neorhizobium galegae bv. officinalis]KAA9387511.1 serine hydrolase [Neorhizobium galegae]KAB1114645.1 serine hydrolase [Neorhizobium galegae]MCM2499239.1 beta-lactamase family protein [Neorhizobium galegae]MCQ1772653.1 beta-lactamase family protein [Neorhizobium galegae]
MRLLVRFVKILCGVIVVGLIGLGIWLYTSPPDLLRVGSGYSAKMVCSNVFLAGRDSSEVLAVDVQAPGHPLLKLMRVSVDRTEKRVHAALLGIFAGNDAVYREGLGCAVVPDGTPVATAGIPLPAVTSIDPSSLWPEGGKVDSDPLLAQILSDAGLAGPGLRAVVVVKRGRIVGEVYSTGFSKDTPLLGWSMTKTVNATILGTLVRNGKLSLEDKNLFPQWQGNQRGDIRITDLAGMESGLAFNENYGAVADVTRMLYLEPDMANFAADQPLEADPGTRFGYSSGTAVMLSKIWMDKIGDRAAALSYPRTALFGPLGMTSAVMETDAAGTFVGSSYMYATARDWARIGLLLARDGVWNGNRILPQGFVALMHQANATPNGRYSKMQTWLPGRDNPGMPADAFFLQGHDGQTITVIPSLDLVVVRLGLTPSWNRYDPTRLVAEVVKTTTAP